MFYYPNLNTLRSKSPTYCDKFILKEHEIWVCLVLGVNKNKIQQNKIKPYISTFRLLIKLFYKGIF